MSKQPSFVDPVTEADPNVGYFKPPPTFYTCNRIKQFHMKSLMGGDDEWVMDGWWWWQRYNVTRKESSMVTLPWMIHDDNQSELDDLSFVPHTAVIYIFFLPSFFTLTCA